MLISPVRVSEIKNNNYIRRKQLRGQYPRDLVKLVVVVGHVKQGDENKRFVTVVVSPAGDSSGYSNDVTFFG